MTIRSAGLSFWIWLMLPLASCSVTPRKEINRRVTLRRQDKLPYGTKVAFEGLGSLFPDATVSYFNKSTEKLPTGDGKTASIIIVKAIDPSPAEINSMLDFVGQGNHMFISARWFGDSLLHALGVKASFNFMTLSMDSLQLNLRQPGTGDSLSFAYPGDSYDGWIDSCNLRYTTILGWDRHGRPDFVRFSYKGGGTIYLHFAPLAFSNFFLLHKNNISYYQSALSYLPGDLQSILWDEYYVYGSRGSRGGGVFSSLAYLLSQKSLAWAFWLMLALILLVYLFESKRRQRPIPVITPLKNTSLEFVLTIGRLYFQRRDNHNLATKMVIHFQDLVRTRYNLNATALDEDLVTRIAHRTGYQHEVLSRLIGYMRVLPSKAYVPDEELMDFHRQLEAFYKIA
ncbi:MAG TPA: DUF4350 domain-containing protein [Puia sp.]|nr:DUF4350 domain-containing protein [Puia sp.]